MVIENSIRTRLSELVSLSMFKSSENNNRDSRRQPDLGSLAASRHHHNQKLVANQSDETFVSNQSTAKLLKDVSSCSISLADPGPGHSPRPRHERDTDTEAGDTDTLDTEERGEWDNPVEFLLSCLSFAVGLGNIWRFPYLCYRNGGGAFLIPYVLSLVCMGLPVFLFEMGSGQFSSEGPIGLWKICPLFQGIGYAMFMLSLYIGTYYNVILSWAFFYIFSSFTTSLPWASCDNWWNTAACTRFDSTNCTAHGGIMNSDEECVFSKDVTVDVWRNLTDSVRDAKMPSDEFFHNFMLDISSGIHDISSLRWELAGCLLLAWIIVYLALWRGIKSIGKLVYFTSLFPYLILVILLVRAATLPGYVDGVMFYLTPQWDKLADINVWADACIQIFFSLGVTWGGMVTLASYNNFSNNVFRDCVMVAFGNCVTSVFAGFVIFGIIGFMAHELGVEVADVAAQGAGLAFIAYPEAVSRMPISPLWSLLFFTMLLSLGFGTQFSTTETVITILTDQFPQLRGRNRRWCTLAVCGLMFSAGLVMVTDAGIFIFQLMDNHAATYSALIIGCSEVTVMAWVYGADKFLEDLRYMLGFYPYPRVFWLWAWKLLSPAIVLSILVFTALDYSGNTYAEYEYPAWANLGGWIITASSVILIPLVAVKKICQEEGSLKQRVAKLVQPTSDWAPDYDKTREECGGEEQCPAFPRDIIRNQTDLTYVDVDCASTRGHQDFPASTRESSSSKECGGSSLEPVSECEEDEGLSMRRNLSP